MQQCLRRLWFFSAIHDCELRAPHIPGDHNLFVDALSSWHIPSSQAKFSELRTYRARDQLFLSQATQRLFLF